MQQQVPVSIDSKFKSDAVSLLSTQLKDNYVFPDIADKMINLIKSNLKDGVYSSVNDAVQFSQMLTMDLQSISKDRHLHIDFLPALAEELKSGDPNVEEHARHKYEQGMESENFGFRKMEILDGNIGYLDLRTIPPFEIGKQTAISAMGFFANTDAIIFDLRKNNGGDPYMVRFLCSYLFDSKPVHLDDIYYRPENKTEEFWTLDNIPGKRLPNVEVYILNSKFTFSGAEEFAYSLKNLKRATLVGETTGGGANPNSAFRLNDYMISFVPTGRSISPITKTNWEGVGVAPDIECNEKDALDIALIEIYKKLIAKSKSPMEKEQCEWKLELLMAKINPLQLSPEEMQKFAGDYGPRKIYFENNGLIYERPGVMGKTKLIAIKPDSFVLEGGDNFKMKFNLDADGKVSSLTGIYDNGHREENKKIN